MIIAGREDRQALADIIQILRNTQNPQVGHTNIKLLKSLLARDVLAFVMVLYDGSLC